MLCKEAKQLKKQRYLALPWVRDPPNLLFGSIYISVYLDICVHNIPNIYIVYIFCKLLNKYNEM